VTFEQFALAHASHLQRLSYALCGDHAQAEDATQEALERVYLRWGRLDDPLPYARKVVLNATRDTWRRFGRRERLGHEAVNDFRAVSDPSEITVERDALLRALRTLPYGQRAVLVLRFWEDLAETETAAALGISVGTVKSQTSRGLRRLREQLSDTTGART
jgi:RNA polymerase sigma-70 factor (sigma-E family)